LAVLSLLAEVAEEQPLVCVVDDAQWLDRASAQALLFVARRLLAEPVALVLVTREPSEELTGFPELVVEGLRDGDARALLASAVRVPLDERVRERLVGGDARQSAGVLELPRGLTPAEIAGGFGLLDAPGCGRIEDSFRRRLAGFRRRPSGCWWSRRRSRSAIRCWCGGRPGGSGSRFRRRPRPTGCSRSARGRPFATLWSLGRVSNRLAGGEQAVHRALADATDPRSIPIALHRRVGPSTRTSRQSWSAAGRAHARRRVRRRSSARRTREAGVLG